MKLSTLSLCLLMTLSALFLCSCSGPKVDETKPIAEIETEADEMDADELYRMAEAYRHAILDKRDDVEDLLDRLKDIEPEELVSAEVKALKTDADLVDDSITALTERFDLYVKLLKAAGGDASKLTLD